MTLALAHATTPMADLRPAARRILHVQTADGAIPWFEDGPWDSWNHAECLMALGVMGETSAMALGFDYLARTQEASGAWACGYGNALPMEGRDHIARIPAPLVRDTNFAAYQATALWHAWRLTGDVTLAKRHWPMVRAAMGFVLTCQHPAGDISWCGEAHGRDEDDAILAAGASIFAAFGHAAALGELVGDPQPALTKARQRLGVALRERPDRFDRAGRDRSGFAMDWYYPILCGVWPQGPALARLEAGRARFIAPGRGCRCVAHEPWATVAESAELALALIRLGREAEAAELLAWQEAHRDTDRAWWMGWQFAEGIPWPLEKPSWTQAAVILAHDALWNTSPASRVLCGGA
jgi:hypothetical protein